eukprot:628022-Heterocapsa_arctica.AAC.3
MTSTGRRACQRKARHASCVCWRLACWLRGSAGFGCCTRGTRAVTLFVSVRSRGVPGGRRGPSLCDEPVQALLGGHAWNAGGHA